MDMRRAIPIALLLCSVAKADQWAFFYPEFVKSFGCRISPVTLQENGTGRTQEIWEAEAYAEQIGSSGKLEHWAFDLARYPLTAKGQNQADKACEKWRHEAEKRVGKAHGLK